MRSTTSPTQLAIEYALANPLATADAIQALFGVRPCDAAYAVQRGIDKRRTDWPTAPIPGQKRPLNNDAALAAARAWAAVNHANEKNLYQQFNITTNQARAIAKEALAAKGGRKADQQRKAMEMIRSDATLSNLTISRRSGVSLEWVRMARKKIQDAERGIVPVVAAPQSRVIRERVRFRQITDSDLNKDGSRVLDDVKRFPSRLGFMVFREVR